MEADVVNVPGLLSDHKPVVAKLLFPRGDDPFEDDPFAPSRDVWRGFPASLPENLLVNPGGEDGLAGWEIEGGGTVTSWRENRVPRTGSGMFAGNDAPDTPGEYWSKGSQTVDVECHQEDIDSGSAVVWVSGYVTTGYKIEQKGDVVSNMPKPYDDGELVLELFGADGQQLATWMSGRRDTLAWHPAAGVVPVPPGTRRARLSWISHHKEANGPSNDALFDDLFLGLGLVDQPHGHVSGDLWPDGGGEAGDFLGTLAADEVPGEGLPLWHVATDLLPVGPFGLYPYAPWSYSGTRYFVSTPRDLPSNQQNGALGVVCWPLDLHPWSSPAMGEGGAVWLRVSGWLRNYKGLSSGWISLWSMDGEPTELWRSEVVQAPEWWSVGGEFPLSAVTGRTAVCLHALHVAPDDPVFGDGFSAEVVERLPYGLNPGDIASH
jgi:hypothetical protein